MAAENDFSLFTSTSYSPARTATGGFSLLHRHLARLRTAHTALAVELPASWCAIVAMPSHDALRGELDRALERADRSGLKGDLRIRLSVLSTGEPRAEAFQLTAMPDYPVRLVLDDRPTSYEPPFLRHKTSRREVYDSARARNGVTLHPSSSPADPPFDVLLFNPDSQLTETTISNIAFRLAPGADAPFVTPSRTCGLLEGVMRAELLERGEVIEGVVTVEQVKAAAKAGTLEIICFNGVRGVFKAYLAADGLE